MFDARGMQFTATRFDDLRSAGQTADGERREGLRLAAVAEQVRPVMLAHEQTLPLVAPLIPLFPDGALRRGITVTVAGAGATSLALALAAAPVGAGSWAALTDLPECNLVAAAEAGVALERVACLHTEGQWAAAVAATIGAFDIVIVGLVHRVRAADVRRLGARARERGSVLVVVQGETSRAVWPEAPDLTLTATGSRWVGLGVGHGHLRARVVEVVAEGRRGFARPRRAEVMFPLGTAPVEQAASDVGAGVVGAAPEAVTAIGRVGSVAGRVVGTAYAPAVDEAVVRAG